MGFGSVISGGFFSYSAHVLRSYRISLSLGSHEGILLVIIMWLNYGHYGKRDKSEREREETAR